MKDSLSGQFLRPSINHCKDLLAELNLLFSLMSILSNSSKGIFDLVCTYVTCYHLRQSRYIVWNIPIFLICTLSTFLHSFIRFILLSFLNLFGAASNPTKDVVRKPRPKKPTTPWGTDFRKNCFLKMQQKAKTLVYRFSKTTCGAFSRRRRCLENFEK